jgi:hypothetical protein
VSKPVTRIVPLWILAVGLASCGNGEPVQIDCAPGTSAFRCTLDRRAGWMAGDVCWRVRAECSTAATPEARVCQRMKPRGRIHIDVPDARIARCGHVHAVVLDMFEFPLP